MQLPPLIDHVNLPVSSVERSSALYQSVLSELGVGVLIREEEVIGFGRNHWEFGIEEEAGDIIPIHIAFSTTSTATVNKIYEIALETGGRDNGSPGLRPEYGSSYYAAYFLDFDGHNLEIVRR